MRGGATLTRVSLRVGAPEGARRVFVLGELSDWRAPREALVDACEAGGRVFELSAELSPGVYEYKLLVDGEWTLDATNSRTRAGPGPNGHRNNVLSVGGAPEPLLFAPTRPFVHEADGGGVLLRAALRRAVPPNEGSPPRLFARWEEADRAQRTELRAVFEEGEHTVFEARLPASSSVIHVRFELDDGATLVGREDTQGAFLVALREAKTDGPPPWWRDAVVYMIFVDRFRGAREDAPLAADPGPNIVAGGHLEGVRRSLGELVDLGVNTLYLTPIHIGASCHRYDIVDPLSIDPEVGGEEAFERLVEEARARGVRVITDLALTHAGRGFPPYEDVLQNGRASRYAAWFQWTEGDPSELVHYGTRRDAPLLNLDCEEVCALALKTVERWAARGVSGLRLDAAAEVPMDLARAIRSRLRDLRPDAVLLGEVVPAHAWRWRAEGAVDAATDFGLRDVAVDFMARRTIDAPTASQRLRSIEIARGGPASEALRFLSTHDHPRFATLARLAGDPSRARLGALFLLTLPGVPAILYGEEVAMAARAPELDIENVWPDRAPMPWRREDRDEGMRALYKRLLALRRGSPALARGDCEILHAEGGVLVYRRSAEGEVVDVAVNASDEHVEVSIEDDERPEIHALADVGGAAVAKTARQIVALPPGSGVIARRSRGADVDRRRRLTVLENARLRDADLTAGALVARSLPSRLDFSITEACNLQCRHCITLAPERTRDRTARSLSPWLLDRLRDALELASYVGFVHGGEPLTAPVLWDVLAALRAARRGNPTMVHLLTNGVLLAERTAARLLEAGVRSISVSLDGASAATNDAIRSGGRFEHILSNLRDLARLRRSSGADVQCGVSFVILRQNAEEAARMVELCAELGLDWLKLEEAVPATPFAARSLLRPDEAASREAVRAALARGRELGVAIVDHTAPPVVWRCKLGEDPHAAAFLVADELANRSEIHPCRVTWEHACIEPNGDVRMGDFFGPVLGSVAEAPISALWNGPTALAERRRAVAVRLCGAGPVTCVPLGARPSRGD